MSENSYEYPLLSKIEVGTVGDNTDRAIQRIQSFSQKHLPLLSKNFTKFDAIYNDLILPLLNAEQPMEVTDEEGQKSVDFKPELSVHAQYILSETMNNFKKILNDMTQDHKNPIHHHISRCGKAIENRFFSDLCKLLKNEKEIENNPDNLAHTNRLILEHLIGLGRNEVAETFINQNSPAAASGVVQQQLGASPAGAPGQPQLANLLNELVTTNPALLHSLLGQHQQQQQSPLLTALAAQLLLPAQQQPQAQLTTSLLQMLNPATATLLAYQNYVQQQQQQQQPANNGNHQLQLLVQLLAAQQGAGGGGQGALAALSGSQQQTLLAALAQQQQQVVSQPPPPHQQDESRLLLEQLIRQSREQQQQQQKLQQLSGGAASRFGQQMDTAQQSPSSNSSSAAATTFQQQLSQVEQQQFQAELIAQKQQSQLLQQQQQQQPTVQQSGVSEEQHSQQQSQQLGQQQPGGIGGGTPNDRLLTSAEAVQDRISRLISENEVIVEPNPVLLKRRPYQRQGTSNSMTSQTSETAGTSQRGSPGIRSPGLSAAIATATGVGPKVHPATTRSFSLHEASFLRLGGGSLTSGQPINRQQLLQKHHHQQQQLTCNFCQLKFPNEAGLEAHEQRCSKKEMLQKQQSQPQLKLAASHHQQQQHQQFQMQLQQLQEHQSTIAALVGGGKGVARDLMLINANGGAAGGTGGGGRASVPSSGSQGGPVRVVPQKLQQQQPSSHHLGQSSSDSRLKKRGLDQDSSAGGSGSTGDSTEMLIDVVSGGPEQQQPGAESTKMARIEPAGTASTSAGQQQPKAEPCQQQQQPQPVLTMRDAIIFAITYSTDLRSSAKMPYFLTLTPADLDALTGGQDEAAGGAGHVRGRTRNITSETFVCLNKVRPTAVEHQDNCSAYSTGWTTSAESTASNGGDDHRLVQLFLTACSTARPSRLDDQMSGQYTLAASRENQQLRTTHSSFWTQQLQQKAHNQQISPLMSRQHSQQEADTEEEEADNEFKGGAIEEATIEALEAKAVVKMEIEDKENTAASDRLKQQQEQQQRQLAAAAVANGRRRQQRHHLVRGRYELNRLPKSGSRAEEMEVYIRGRGRGRYVCERCGIRCKKPSMLKKHLRSHTNVRPFTCLTCNFSFKTKGNLTKHLVSKAHRKRMMDAGGEGTREEEEERAKRAEEEEEDDFDDEAGEGRLVVAEEEEDGEGGERQSGREQKRKAAELERRRLSHLGALERKFVDGEFDQDDEDDDDEWDEEEDTSPQQEVPPPPPGSLTYRRFGQENILVERETHTPPTLWTLMCLDKVAGAGGENGGRRERQPGDNGDDQWGEETDEPSEWGWPQPDEAVRERGCHSAPPVALCSPEHHSARARRKRKRELVEEEAKHHHQEEAPPCCQQPALANFIPPVRTTIVTASEQQQLCQPPHQPPPVQMQFQQPSLASQLAAGLLQAASFHSHPPAPIGIAAAGQQQTGGHQQLLFPQLGDQHQPPLPSAFAPPSSALTGVASGTEQPLATTNNGMMISASENFARAQSTLEAFLANEVQSLQCDQCERKFRKDSELLLHKQTHLIERNARQKAFQCQECPTVVRSKALLARHSETVHGRGNTSLDAQQQQQLEQHMVGRHHLLNSSAATALLPQSSASSSNQQHPLVNLSAGPVSAQMLPPPSAGQNHFRNFRCTDCDLGFRSHGVLAKHLRSKNHFKALVNLGKLPEDANALLVREHAKALNSIDASNCEKALSSTKQLLAKMREQIGLDGAAMLGGGGQGQQPATSADEGGLECREHLSASTSPSPQSNDGQTPSASSLKAAPASLPRISSSLASGLHRRPAEPLPHGLKRKNNADGCPLANDDLLGHRRENSFSCPSPPRPKLSREDLLQQAESPLHSLAQVAAAVAAAQQLANSRISSPHLLPPSSSSHAKPPSAGAFVVTNVWVPPKLEQLTNDQRKSSTPELHNGVPADRISSLFSNRSAEETSESTGTRSESSTPVQRVSNNFHHQQMAAGFSPMTAATRCQLCGDLNFDSPAELAVHFHADHVLMRHGRDFRCTRRNCEKVFPSRDSLRAHIHAHFFGGGAGFDPSGREGSEHFQATPFIGSCPASPSSLLVRRPPAPSAPPPSAQSPGMPEESQSAMSSQLHPSQQQAKYQRGQQQSFSSPPSVASISFGSPKPSRPSMAASAAVNRTSKQQQNGVEERGEHQQHQSLTNAAASLLCCQFCAERLPDVQALQAHWVKQHMAQLTRPHVCAECDAGFTSEEALRAHSQRQHGPAAADGNGMVEAVAEGHIRIS